MLRVCIRGIYEQLEILKLDDNGYGYRRVVESKRWNLQMLEEKRLCGQQAWSESSTMRLVFRIAKSARSLARGFTR